jgi:phosphoribosylcarboxyaminoimidazole (NCAIR) mutase
MLASAGDENLAQKLDEFRKNQSDKVKASELSAPANG